MFQLKNSGSGSEEPSLANKLPNFHGKVRTFKEDAENFEKKGTIKNVAEEESHFPLPIEKKVFPEKPLTGEKSIQSQPISQKKKAQTENPFQSIPTPAPLSSPNSNFSTLKSSHSQSFFSEKPPAAESVLPSQVETRLSSQKPKKATFASLAILLAAIISAAGFYYYWFYIKSATPATPVAPKTDSSENTAPVIPSDNTQNKTLRKIIVDISQDSTGIKSVTTTFATDFFATASEGDLIEVKVLNKENQPIGKKDFFAGFGITVPDAIAMKFSEDYSLFIKKEGGAAKLGLVFKTVTSSGIADEMKNWEPTIIADLNSLYLGQVLSPAGTFSSSKYKNADIRYFNFSSPAGTSLDYSVIANFLVIGTSKDAIRTTLDYMSEK